MSKVIFQREDILYAVRYDRGNTVLKRMESKAALRNRMQAAGDPRVRYLLQQLDKHPIQSPTMKWSFLPGEEELRSVIDSYCDVSLQTCVV